MSSTNKKNKKNKISVPKAKPIDLASSFLIVAVVTGLWGSVFVGFTYRGLTDDTANWRFIASVASSIDWSPVVEAIEPRVVVVKNKKIENLNTDYYDRPLLTANNALLD